jgi:hypothetical protein
MAMDKPANMAMKIPSTEMTLADIHLGTKRSSFGKNHLTKGSNGLFSIFLCSNPGLVTCTGLPVPSVHQKTALRGSAGAGSILK